MLPLTPFRKTMTYSHGKMNTAFLKFTMKLCNTIMLRPQTQITNYPFKVETDLISSLDLICVSPLYIPDLWQMQVYNDYTYLSHLHIQIAGSNMRIWFSWMIFWLKREDFLGPIEVMLRYSQGGPVGLIFMKYLVEVHDSSPLILCEPPSLPLSLPSMIPHNVPNPNSFQLDLGCSQFIQTR